MSIKHHYTDDESEKFQSIMLEADKLTMPSVGIFDAPTRCYTINQEWAKLAMGMVSLLAETKMWDGALTENHPAITQILEFLIGGDCMNCNDIALCLDTNPVQIAQAEFTYNQLASATQAAIDEMALSYDGVTPQSVFPSIPTTAASANADDDAALCYAIFAFINLYAANKAAAINIKNQDTSSYWSRIKRYVSAAWDSAVSLGGSIWGYFTGNVDESIASASLNNSDDIKAFACCLKDALRSSPLNETSWGSALASCASTNDAASLAASDLNNTDSFLYFLNVYNETIGRQSAGADIYCPCDGWCVEFSGDDLGSNWYSVPGEGAVWSGSSYEISEVLIAGAKMVQGTIRIDFDMAYDLRAIEFEYDIVKGVNTGSFIDGIYIYSPSATPMDAVRWIDMENGNGQKRLKILNGLGLDIAITLRASWTMNATPPGGSGRIKRVKLRGVGTRPAIGRDCWE